MVYRGLKVTAMKIIASQVHVCNSRSVLTQITMAILVCVY